MTRRIQFMLVGPLVASWLTLHAWSAQAQTHLDGRVGVMVTSALVQDRIVDDVTARPALAPTLGVAIGTQLDPRYAVAVAASWSRSDLELSGEQTRRPVIPLTIWTGMVSVQRAFQFGITAQARVGILKYRPATDGRDATLFRGDAPAVPLVGVGVGVGRRIGAQVAVGLDVLYDVHRFTTAALREVGFDASRTVHRVSIGATFRRSYGTQAP